MSLLAFPAVLRAAETFSDSTAPQQQQQKTRTLSGTVLDAVTNEPVIGAAVQVRGRQGGEITDLDGMFTINVPSGAVITVTSLGYRSQSLNVGNRDNIRILLEPDSEVLEDVVVTAFGVGQKKESVVGAVQLVRPESLIVPSANLSTAFAGRLAGVVSFQRSGMPGQNGSDFYIRGISTISGVTSPLIILDGVEISAGDLNAIDPEIIEGFSILKDATATAMYGTRGANGVMIITTKSGRDLDRPIIGFRIETNVTTPTRLPNRYAKAWRNILAAGAPHSTEGDVFCKLVPFWQLQLYFGEVLGQTPELREDKGGFYPDVFEYVRTSPDLGTAGEQQTEFVLTCSKASGHNLLDFFTKWGFLTPVDASIDDYGSGRMTVTESRIEEIRQRVEALGLPKPDSPIEYITDNNKGLFKTRPEVIPGSVSVSSSGTVTLTDWKNVVVFEVRDADGGLVFASEGKLAPSSKAVFSVPGGWNPSYRLMAVSATGERTEVRP